MESGLTHAKQTAIFTGECEGETKNSSLKVMLALKN